MAKTNIFHIFSSLSEISTPKLTSNPVRWEFASFSATRLLCSATEQPREENVGEEKNLESKTEGVGIESKSEEGEGDEEDYDINKETGEIGGPRGPEPTRYGDWERNGRCSDF